MSAPRKLSIPGQIAQTAAEHGWTTEPIGRIGTVYTRGDVLVRVIFTTDRGRTGRSVKEWEVERRLADGTYRWLRAGYNSDRGKRESVLIELTRKASQ